MFAIIEVNTAKTAGPIGRDLLGFVPFAGNQNYIPACRIGNRGMDRSRAIGLDVGFGASIRIEPTEDFVDDSIGWFGARVITGDDNRVAELVGDLSHAGAFGSVSIAATTEDAADVGLGVKD